ncbi:MAG: ferritin-like domain-containing protein [Alphaproteobacteria bacterium]|nr:ferritin-like domain-containing protein [Alphaproteobacteria bacterium]
MSSMFRYQLPVEETEWKVDSKNDVSFVWEYEDGNDDLLKLYDKGKKQQWDAAERVDWSQDLDPENPMLMPDEMIRIYGSPMWDKMTDQEKAHLRRHTQAWQSSQFLHGEQGALMVTARIVETVPDINAKFYAATQVMDEARHVEAYSRLLHDKFELSYPITPPLAALLENVLHDKRWDFNYLGMQVLIEGLALAAFHAIRDMSRNELSASVNAYVMQDEARHVAFGRLALRDYYPQLTSAELREREEFVIEGCWHMRDRFTSNELWAAVGLPEKDCIEWVEKSEAMRLFRTRLFSRIVPIVKDIGLWTDQVQDAFTKMGLLELCDPDLDIGALLDHDAKVAEEFDARRHVGETIAAAE